MQSANHPLVAASISTVIAITSAGATPAQADPLFSPSQADSADSQTIARANSPMLGRSAQISAVSQVEEIPVRPERRANRRVDRQLVAEQTQQEQPLVAPTASESGEVEAALSTTEATPDQQQLNSQVEPAEPQRRRQRQQVAQQEQPETPEPAPSLTAPVADPSSSDSATSVADPSTSEATSAAETSVVPSESVPAVSETESAPELTQEVAPTAETQETAPTPATELTQETAPTPEPAAEPTTESAPAPTAEPTAAPTAEPAPAPEERRRRRRRAESPIENLEPNPNPLTFPTQPEEVQTTDAQPITLQQAIDLAVRNNEDLQQTRLELEQAEAALRQAQAANNPTVSVSGSLTRTGTDAPVNSPITDPETGAPTGETETVRQQSDSLPLQGQLQVNYDLFTSGQRSASIRAAEGQVRVRQLRQEIETEQLVLDVTGNYYDLQSAAEQVRIFRDQVAQAEQSLRDAEALERAGVGTRFDVLQAQVDLANAQQQLRNQLSQQEIARRQLVETLNLAQTADVVPADAIEVAGTWDLSLEDSIVQAYRNRAELEQLLVQRDISEEQRRAALAQLGPQVGLSAGLSAQRDLDTDGGELPDGFTVGYQVAINANLVLYDGGAARAQARQRQKDGEIAESQFASARDQIRFRVEQAYSQLQANAENIQTASVAVEQATEALRLARLRFQAGVGTQTDVLRSQTELTRAEVNRLNAIIEYNRALATLRRNVSNFPDGFLADTP